MKQLIVNADDYGHTPGVAEGIRRAHLEGIVTSTSAMMNRPFIDKELPKLIEQCPRMGIGVHLVMTSGKPLLPSASLPSLMSLSPDGQTFNHDPLSRIESINPEEVRAEWHAQINKFIRIAGRAPDHLDAHHHAMCFSKKILAVFLELAKEYECSVRRPNESAWLEANPIAREICMPDRLDTRFYDEGVSKQTLEQMADDITEGTTEWMCHPAIVDDEIMKTSVYNTCRGKELSQLTQPEIRERIDRNDIKLVSFAFLAGMGGNKCVKSGENE